MAMSKEDRNRAAYKAAAIIAGLIFLAGIAVIGYYFMPIVGVVTAFYLPAVLAISGTSSFWLTIGVASALAVSMLSSGIMARYFFNLTYIRNDKKITFDKVMRDFVLRPLGKIILLSAAIAFSGITATTPGLNSAFAVIGSLFFLTPSILGILYATLVFPRPKKAESKKQDTLAVIVEPNVVASPKPGPKLEVETKPEVDPKLVVQLAPVEAKQDNPKPESKHESKPELKLPPVKSKEIEPTTVSKNIKAVKDIYLESAKGKKPDGHHHVFKDYDPGKNLLKEMGEPKKTSEIKDPDNKTMSVKEKIAMLNKNKTQNTKPHP